MRREARAVSHEDRWVTSLKKALVKAGVTVDKIAGAVAGALDAERMGVGEDGKAVSLGPHHSLRLKAVSLATEIHAPRRVSQLDAARPMLHIHAGARVQMILFGEVREPLPEAGTVVPSVPTPMSDPLMAQLIRSGRILPSGEAVKPAEAKTEAPKALPEGKGRERERWLK